MGPLCLLISVPTEEARACEFAAPIEPTGILPAGLPDAIVPFLALVHTVAADLSDLADVKYDILAFFSPSGIKSLRQNFPDFVQGKTRIAAFGPTTAKAVRDMGLMLDIEAPMPNAPSMTGALELFIKKANNL